MFVSILQRFVFWVSQGAGQPLQSRADQNTRKTESRGQPGTKPAKKQVEDYLSVVFRAGKRRKSQVRQTNQEIWQQEGLNRTAVVWPGSRLRGLKGAPVQLSRGDTL